jgi:DNA replication and repair protein RecF
LWVRRLELENFRNIDRMSIDLGAGFNFFFGLNGAGKSAVLEAVHVLARGRSFRTGQLQDLIKAGMDRFVVRALIEDEHMVGGRLVFSRSREGQTEIRIDGEPARRMSQLASLIPMEVMTPEMVELVFGGPSLRRQWLDWGVFHVKHDHAAILRRYGAALRQRNACLRQIAAGRAQLGNLQPWTVEMTRLGQSITEARVAHLEGLETVIRGCLETLGAGFSVEIGYRRGWPDGADLGNVLGESVSREVKSGATNAGPHRADVDLRVHGQPCSSTLSRGEAKILASALMLSQSDRIRALAARKGLFLIDDIGAELDDVHRRHFFDALVGRGVQVFATSVVEPDKEILARCADHSLFHVERGQVHPVTRD